MSMEFSGKHIAVLGFGAEGRAAAEFLVGEGADVEVFDVKKESAFAQAQIDAMRGLAGQGVLFHLAEDRTLNGFDLAVRSPGMARNHPWITQAKTERIPVTSGTAIFFERCPAPIVGVTGTKGKGTTSTLIYEMLSAAGKKAELLGNIGVPALSRLSSITSDTLVVFELSSFQLLEVERSPHIAVILMVTQDHLDIHGSVVDYVEAKRTIVKYQTSDDFVIANIDYGSSRSIGESSKAEKFWVSRRRPVQQGCSALEGMVELFRNNTCERIIPISEVKLPGAHNLENVCAAVAAASILGVPAEAMRKVLKTFEGLEHRLRLVGEKNGVCYYDDSISTTPESAIAAIEAFKEPKVLILGGSSKGADFSALGAVIRSTPSVRGIVGIGEEWPRIKEEVRGASCEVGEGMRTMTEAVAAAADLARPGDAVILSPACASFDMFTSYKDRGDQFIKAVGELPD